MPALIEATEHEAQQAEALEMLLEYLNAIVLDEVVIWSEAGSGGSFGLRANPNWLPPNVQAWLWSGRPYQRIV